MPLISGALYVFAQLPAGRAWEKWTDAQLASYLRRQIDQDDREREARGFALRYYSRGNGMDWRTRRRRLVRGIVRSRADWKYWQDIVLDTPQFRFKTIGKLRPDLVTREEELFVYFTRMPGGPFGFAREIM